MVATHFFGKRYKNRVLEDFEKPDFLEKKMVELLPARFQGPPFFGCYFFLTFFFLLFSVSSASSKRVCQNNPIFIGFFAHPSKASSLIMQQQGSKAKTPQKKVHNFFFGNPFFDQFFSKTLILHHPLKTVHQKISKKPYFYRLKKRWPSY